MPEANAVEKEPELNNEIEVEVEAIEQELDIIAKYHDQVEVLNKYFKRQSTI